MSRNFPFLLRYPTSYHLPHHHRCRRHHHHHKEARAVNVTVNQKYPMNPRVNPKKEKEKEEVKEEKWERENNSIFLLDA